MAWNEDGGTFATTQKVTPVKITVVAKGFTKFLFYYGATAAQVWDKIAEDFNFSGEATTAKSNGTARRGRPRKTKTEQPTTEKELAVA